MCVRGVVSGSKTHSTFPQPLLHSRLPTWASSVSIAQGDMSSGGTIHPALTTATFHTQLETGTPMKKKFEITANVTMSVTATDSATASQLVFDTLSSARTKTTRRRKKNGSDQTTTPDSAVPVGLTITSNSEVVDVTETPTSAA